MSHDVDRSPYHLSRRAAFSAAGTIGALAVTLGVGGTIGRAAAQVATPGAPDTSLTELIRATEGERLRALVEADMDVADQLHADDFQLINPAGATLSKADYLGGIAAGDIDYLVFEPVSEIQVRLYGQAAVIRYESQLEIVVGGQEVALSHYWHTDIYEEHEGRWRAVWSQATEIL